VNAVSAFSSLTDLRRGVRRLLVFLCLATTVAGVRGQSPWPDAASVAEAMRRANNYWITNNSAGNSGWARGAYYTGNQRAFRVLGERAYHNWANSWGGINLWKIGPEGSGSADAFCCGQTYIDLYRLDGLAVQLTDIKAKTDALVASPAVNGWSWIDAFYMQGPVLARLGNLTSDTNYFQKLWVMFDYLKSPNGYGLFDTNAALWFRDGNYIYPTATTASGQKVFWARGNGWVFAGLARVIQQLPTNAPHYQDYVTLFQMMAPALKAVQSPDGMWRSSLLDTNQFPNPETSGTGFFTYGFAWGIRSGLLPAADYTNTVTLAWQGLTNLALNAAGRVGYVQGVGAQPAAATAGNTTDFGVGAFLLASSEIYLLSADAPALRPWAGPDQTLLDVDLNGWEPIMLDATQTEIYRGSAVSYAWWEGTNQIGAGVIVQTNLNLGQHVITLKVLGSDGTNYTDAMAVTVSQPVIVTPSLKLHFDFEDDGLTTTDSVAGVGLNLVNFSGTATNLHGALGSGVGNAGRALDFTAATAQGGNGPLASTVGNSSIHFGAVNAFTLTLWIKPTASLINGFPRLFSLGTNGTVDRANTGSLQLLGNGGFQASTSVQGFVNAAQTSTSGFGAYDMPVNRWSFLALTYDGTTLNFYGGSETNAVTLKSSASFPAGIVNLGSAWTLFLGNRITPTRDRAFCGWMDDVRFYLEAAPVDYLEAVRATAIAPPVISALKSGTNLWFQTGSKLGTAYILQTATNLTAPVNWTSMLTNPGTGGSITNAVPVNAAPGQKYFRYLLQ